jgi:MoaA/NifB/PqqE/SkfB family radical SAM enzyme
LLLGLSTKMNKLYSDLKIFNFPTKISDISKRVVSSPIHVRLKPTNRCNHRCYYCCYRNDKLYLSQLFRENDEISWEKMKEIIVDFGRMGVRAVTFSGGGEPLCYPYFVEAVNKLFSLGIKVGVLTNGSLLKDKVAETLAKKADWVRISMDAANPDTYALARNVSAREFNSVCSNIRNFSRFKKGRCYLGVNFIVTLQNCSEIYKFLELMKRIGVGHVKLSEAVISTNKEENRDHYRQVSGLVRSQVLKGLANLADNSFSIIDRFDYSKNREDGYNKDYTSCPFSQCLTVIGADANIYACQDKAYTKKGKLGSIKQYNFSKIWFSNQTKNKMLKLNPSKDCLHHCAQHAKNLLLLDYLDIYKDHTCFV